LVDRIKEMEKWSLTLQGRVQIPISDGTTTVCLNKIESQTSHSEHSVLGQVAAFQVLFRTPHYPTHCSSFHRHLTMSFPSSSIQQSTGLLDHLPSTCTGTIQSRFRCSFQSFEEKANWQRPGFNYQDRSWILTDIVFYVYFSCYLLSSK
jgi:hypothetical protein